MTNWEQQQITGKVEACRTGWLGAWDAFKSAVTGDARIVVTKEVTFSVWAKGNCDLSLVQVESENDTPQ